MKTAILFKTHIWDEVVERNFLRCKRYGKESDIYILLDPAAGAIIPEPYCNEDRIFLIPYSNIEKLGFEHGIDNQRSGYWYNGDYHQHLFILDHPDYDYICTIENDVSAHTSFNMIFKRMNEDGVDVIYYPQTQPNTQWSHLEGSVGYSDTTRYIHKGLFCVAFFSRRAAFHVFRRRLEMSTLRRKKQLKGWPIGETVMVHELVENGMTAAALSEYCDHLDMYDWSPCFLPVEDDVVQGRTFVHPVTALNDKFINSNFQQDYHSLFSEQEVISGLSRKRARCIADLEVYGRLFNSVHMQWVEERWRPLLDDAAKILSEKAQQLLGGRNWLRPDDLVLATEGDTRSPSRLFISPLPSWDMQHGCHLRPGDVLTVRVPRASDRSFTLVTGSEDSRLPERLRVQGPEGQPLEVMAFGTWRKMFFFSLEVPEDISELRFSAPEHPVGLCSMRLNDGTGSVADWNR